MSTLTLSGRPLLPLALRADAAVSGANGVAYLALAGPLEELLGIEASLLRVIGAVLVVFALAVAYVAAHPKPGAVLAVIETNVLWVVGSVIFLAAGASDPTTVGSVWIGLQAAVVAGFAALQWISRRA